MLTIESVTQTIGDSLTPGNNAYGRGEQIPRRASKLVWTVQVKLKDLAVVDYQTLIFRHNRLSSVILLTHDGDQALSNPMSHPHFPLSELEVAQQVKYGTDLLLADLRSRELCSALSSDLMLPMERASRRAQEAWSRGSGQSALEVLRRMETKWDCLVKWKNSL